ncbi:MAG: ROK family protein [Janthinobacterium lividum]
MHTANKVTIGIDLGGTSMRVGVFDDAMQLLHSTSMPTQVAGGPERAVARLTAAVQDLLATVAESKPGLQPFGIGIGSPGPINLRTGVLGVLPNLPGWENFPLRDRLADAAGLPVVLECDANAAAIAEWKLGAGQAAGLDSMAMVTLGTGVGSGLILGGKVWHGMFGMGGEVGHATVDPGGWACGCGSRGCLEVYASANGLIRLVRSIVDASKATPPLKVLAEQPEPFTPLQVAQLAEAGDASAILAFERLGHYLGIGIANLINTLDLPMIVVGGGVASAWPLFAPAMFRSVKQYSYVYGMASPTQLETMETDRTFIRPALLGPAAGLLGAALLPVLAGQDKAQMNLSLHAQLTA